MLFTLNTHTNTRKIFAFSLSLARSLTHRDIAGGVSAARIIRSSADNTVIKSLSTQTYLSRHCTHTHTLTHMHTAHTLLILLCVGILHLYTCYFHHANKKTLLSMHNWNVLLHLRKSQETFLHFFCFDAKIFLTSLTFLLQIRVCSPPPLPLLHRPEHEINRNNGVRMFFCFACFLTHTRAHIHCSHHSRAFGSYW